MIFEFDYSIVLCVLWLISFFDFYSSFLLEFNYLIGNMETAGQNTRPWKLQGKYKCIQHFLHFKFFRSWTFFCFKKCNYLEMRFGDFSTLFVMIRIFFFQKRFGLLKKNNSKLYSDIVCFYWTLQYLEYLYSNFFCYLAKRTKKKISKHIRFRCCI